MANRRKNNKKLKITITELADRIGITPRTIMRWEQRGKIQKAKRDWRGWRVYLPDDAKTIQQYFEVLRETN
ncbi:MerR family DNA-binding transcriptional regulator [PVC group bacterium]|nr:MerR family DNA-binding transcriptional regulator [PVC group bacterium]MCH7589970.1 MerR family DNA-binding transcriptional regulator [PVC group bacterium]